MTNDEADWRPQEMPTLVIGRIARLLARLDDEGLKDVGISVAQLPVLVALKNGQMLTQKELSAIAGVEQPSMAQLLGRMERDGLIRRTPDPSDKRSSLVSLEAEAYRRLEPGRDVLRGNNREALAGLSPEEVRTLTELLQRIHANLTGC
ncbi:MarR family winged helix-turn-helix transcriptional regulator [Ensifer sp. ENS06]|uniref:MarR family winged helix-turn-helix transcriptional regulator n=1 Tax=Ensifer sp. ENS06 TaxID=2769276 RepID=UPI001FED909B|nr:MarR family transcriptional regulator [Ensifer sp. ENS06]